MENNTILSRATSAAIRAVEQTGRATSVPGALIAASSISEATKLLGSIPDKNGLSGRSISALSRAVTEIKSLVAAMPPDDIKGILSSPSVDLANEAEKMRRDDVRTDKDVFGSLDSPAEDIPASAVGGRAHLLILTTESGKRFYFGLGTAAFNSLKRSTTYNVATQERLQRPEAAQAVAQGGETINISGVIYGARGPGISQINELRSIADTMKPVMLVTGYGEILGRWYVTKIEEDQSFIVQDGAPLKQEFSMEFKRYGEDR